MDFNLKGNGYSPYPLAVQTQNNSQLLIFLLHSGGHLPEFLFFVKLYLVGCVAQWLERFSDKEEVAGSTPATPTILEWAYSSVG